MHKMKLVRDFTERDMAFSFAKRLRRKGIPNHIAMFRGNNTHRYGGGPKTWAVWTLIDNQHDDAIQLIKNKGHKVQSPLSEPEIIQFELDLAQRTNKSVLTQLAIFTAGLLSLMVFIIYLWYSRNA